MALGGYVTIAASMPDSPTFTDDLDGWLPVHFTATQALGNLRASSGETVC